MPAWTSPVAIPLEEIRFADREWRLPPPRRGSRRPSIDPDFRYRFVALHQRCAKFDRALFLRHCESDPPASGRRIWLRNDVLDFGLFRRDSAPDIFGIDGFQLLADEIKHEYLAVVALGADPCPRKPRQRRGFWRVRSPVQPIGIGMLSLRLQGRFRMPKTGNIIVDFLLGGNLDQLHLAFAPVADRLSPQARTSLKARLQILVGGKILLPLHQSKAMRIEIGKGADLKVFRIVKRTP